MIFFNPQKKAFQKVITIALLMFFVLSSLAGATESVLCIDQDETHIVEQEHFPLVACHTLNIIHPEITSLQIILQSSREHHENACVDIALSFYDSSIPPHKLKKVIPKELPRLLASSYLQQLVTASHLITAVSPRQIDPSISPLTSLRTVVLLI